MEREKVRTKLPKGVLLEMLAEEAIRTRQFAGIGFRGAEHSRRAWVIGTGLDVWEILVSTGAKDAREFSRSTTSQRGN